MRLRAMLWRLRSATRAVPDSREEAGEVLDGLERDVAAEPNPIARAFLTGGVTMLRGVNGGRRGR